MDIAQATNTPEVLDLAGERFPVRPLTFAEWGQLQAFIKRHAEGPVARVARELRDARAAGEPYDEETANQLLSHAHREAVNWPPRVGSWQWFEALDRCEGGATEIVLLVLSRTVPDLTRERAAAIAEKATRDEFGDFIYFALYGERVAPAPKSEAASAAAEPTAAKPKKRRTRSRSETSGRQRSGGS